MYRLCIVNINTGRVLAHAILQAVARVGVPRSRAGCSAGPSLQRLISPSSRSCRRAPAAGSSSGTRLTLLAVPDLRCPRPPLPRPLLLHPFSDARSGARSRRWSRLCANFTPGLARAVRRGGARALHCAPRCAPHWARGFLAAWPAARRVRTAAARLCSVSAVEPQSMQDSVTDMP